MSEVRSEKKSGGLYLARTIIGRPGFSVRQSVLDDRRGFHIHRNLFDLGHDPARYLTYSDNSFHIRGDLVKAVAAKVEGDASALLEEVLLPFMRKEFRDKLETAIARRRSLNLAPVTAAEREAMKRELHVFDLRRLHYLWYGSIDQGFLQRMPAKLRRRLLGKSRDEKEQYFVDRERVLYADQVKEYLYTVFDLQRHFSESYARIMPGGLDQEKLDTLFLEELCRLHLDRDFWRDMEIEGGLQSYLVRYLILFFDYDFSESEALNDYIRQFMNSHRRFAYPSPKSLMSLEEASGVFGEPADRLAKLGKKELKKLFRRRAKKLHPDTGGDPEKFVRLKEAFEVLYRER